MVKPGISLIRQQKYVGDLRTTTFNQQIIGDKQTEQIVIEATNNTISINNELLNGSNFYFLTYKDTLTDNYQSYRRGVEKYNRILCENTRFIDNDGKNNEKDDIISYSATVFKNGISEIFNKIKLNFYGDDKKKSSLVSLNIDKLYNYFFKEIYNDYTIIGEPSLNFVTSAMSDNIKKEIPIYITWGHLTPKLMHYMKINNNNLFNDYLINFGPSYYDELFRLNLLVYNLKENTVNPNTINTKTEVNNLNLSDTTIFYIIIDGNFYNNALKFLYNYANNITIYNLLSTTFNNSLVIDPTTTISLDNIDLVEYRISDDDSILYKLYLNKIVDNKSVLQFNRPQNSNIDDEITSYPNVVLINIPDAESLKEKKNGELGKAINKSFDIMKKHYFTLSQEEQDKSYIYIKTSEHYISEKSLIKTLISSENSFGDQPNSNNNYFLTNNKVILSSYNNIEFTLKKLADENKELNISNINNLNILSSYDLEYRTELVDLQALTSGNPNIDITYLTSVSNYVIKDNIELNNIKYLSNQKMYLGILDSNFINYLINKCVIDNYQRNFKNTNTSLFNKILGNQIYDLYKNIEIFESTATLNQIYYINEIFKLLISKYINDNNLIFSSSTYAFYRQVRFNNPNSTFLQSALFENIRNFSFSNNSSRIRNFSLYNIDTSTFIFNKKNINSTNIDENISNITECDNFSSAISSVFYEYIILKNINLSINYNTNIEFDLNIILDKINSIISPITNEDFTFAELINNCSNIKLRFIELNNIILESNGTIINLNDTINNIDNFYINASSSGSYFKLQLEIDNIKNIFNNNDIFTLYSNICEVTIN